MLSRVDPNIQTPPLAVNRREAARVLGCSTDLVDRLVEAGKLKKIKIGTHRVCITWQSLAEYVGEQSTR